MAGLCINVNETMVALHYAVNDGKPKDDFLAFWFCCEEWLEMCWRMFSSIPGPLSATAMQRDSDLQFQKSRLAIIAGNDSGAQSKSSQFAMASLASTQGFSNTWFS
jgi:hypothetical protein